MRDSGIVALIRDNMDRPRSLEVRAAADGAEASIYVYDAIDSYWGVSASSFVEAMNGITAPTIHLHINSPGGDVFEARAMATAIRAKDATVIAHIDGIAASAATYVALAADSVEIADGAMMMIHNAWALAMGNADDMIQMADVLSKIDGTIVADYARKTGQSAEQLRTWMAAETWFTAQEALDAGFVDSIAGAADASATNRWNLAAYNNAPKALQAASEPAAEEILLPAGLDHAALERKFALYQRTPGQRRAA